MTKADDQARLQMNEDNPLGRYVTDLGPLRTMMAAIVVLLVLGAPAALAPTSAHGWAVVPTVVAPALFVIFIFVLPLDLIMTLIFRSDKEGEERARLSRVLVTELFLTVLLAATWTPFIMQLISAGD